jgi:hypothetical protein
VCIHVHVEDAAFHNLDAPPIIKIDKSCKCQDCSTLVDSIINDMRQRLDQMSDDKAEGSTGSSCEKSGDSMSQFEFPQMQREINKQPSTSPI